MTRERIRRFTFGAVAVLLFAAPASFSTGTRVATAEITAPPFITSWGGSGAGGGKFDGPRGIGAGYLRPGLNVSEADSGAARVQTFSSMGERTNSFGAPGQFLSPSDSGIGAYGDVWIVDSEMNRVSSLGLMDCCRAITLGGPDPGDGSKQFNHPRSIAFGDELNGKFISEYEYIADTGNNRISKFDFNGGFINNWGTFGSGPGQFNQPSGIALNGTGKLVYVADTGNNRIEEFDLDGHFLRQWGTLGSGDGQFNNPLGVAVDRNGNVYVADTGNDRIQIFDANGVFQTSFGSTGSGDGEFSRPRDLTFSPHSSKSNLLFVLDAGNSRIEVFGTLSMDASISSHGTDAGGGLEGPKPADSRVTRVIPEHSTADFTVHLYNQGDEQLKVDVTGDGSTGRFQTRYLFDGADISDEVTADPGFPVALDPGQEANVDVTIRSLRGSSGRSYTNRIQLSDPVDGLDDSVEARVRVR